jgi:hypothetical protein
MHIRVSVARQRDLCRKALLAGASMLSLGRVEWEIAGRCERPVLLEFSGIPHRGADTVVRSGRG